ncbi:hypothetical protein GF339_19995 [candidate division KSB3 bacterium]|uniref:Molybdopterin synthase sulfur carrier subunit n=1 Tax=candidate division KSB3 bacterium TaxID=2044937 RepID=A0A9D5Q817_9BACT|nr:hypothetical protein [candidate division KSB3 bacterium]MBD3326877.1 hypothetical protein [candidate division KSB3 bacterium]
MKIQIKYLTSLRDQTGKRQETINVPPGSTLDDVAAWLKEHRAIALPDEHIMTTLNGRGWDQFPSQWATELQDGDAICLFPPIGGG